MSLDHAKAEQFYQDDGDKVKINWFCYEYANNLFIEIRSGASLGRYRKEHTQEQIAAFCVRYAKRLRKSVFDALLGHTKGVGIRESYICEFYPDVSHRQMQGLFDAASKAWENQLSGCSGCPSRCLQEGCERTPMFDALKETGWPT
jgi:hypothetical protein